MITISKNETINLIVFLILFSSALVIIYRINPPSKSATSESAPSVAQEEHAAESGSGFELTPIDEIPEVIEDNSVWSVYCDSEYYLPNLNFRSVGEDYVLFYGFGNGFYVSGELADDTMHITIEDADGGSIKLFE